jgi:hypothetical protein
MLGRSKLIRDGKAFWHCSNYRVTHSPLEDEAKCVVERCREGIQRGGRYEYYGARMEGIGRSGQDLFEQKYFCILWDEISFGYTTNQQKMLL